ncbi:alpha/beta hydrolase [Foetidibacter luteolus]|uniref:alpha/beta hydrolase n=1 Tax=Foetidibacter luteolus TaxID=2608880 RepID=UPI00129A20D4|nr:alpha/beta hydrolase [Foetidibacter luteolus]
MERFVWKFKETSFAGYHWRPQQYDYVVILVHGIGEYAGRYKHVAAFFNRQNIAVTSIDLYGHGYSDGQRGASKGLVFSLEYLSAFINTSIKEYKCPAILYGHSMGGGLAAGLLLRKKTDIAAAILTSPGLVVAQMPRLKEKLLCMANFIVPNLRISQGFQLEKITRNTEAVNAFRNDPATHGMVSIRLAYEMICNGRWCIANAHRLKHKTLLIHGTCDHFTNINGSREFAAGANKTALSFIEWPGGYHELHNEPDAAAFFDRVIQWLKETKVLQGD